MKKYILTILLLAYIGNGFLLAQNTNHKKWQQIDSLLKIGLQKTAGTEIDKLYLSSKKRGDIADFIQAVFYKSELAIMSNNLPGFIELLEQEIINLSNPNKQILQSVAAASYARYYSDGRWEINERTKVRNGRDLPITEWTKENYFDKIINHTDASLLEATKTASVILDEDLIVMADSTINLKNLSLYELLAYRAIQSLSAFMNESENHEAEINPNPKLMTLYPDFIKLDFTKINTYDFRFQVLKNYQKLLKFQLQKKDNKAILYTDLNRLRFIKEVFYPSELYDADYLSVLNKMAEQNKKSEIVTSVYYEIANTYFKRGQKYQPYEYPEYQWEFKKSLEFAQLAIRAFPSTAGAKDCQELIKAIHNPLLEITARAEYLPDHPILASLTYQNLDQVYLRLVPVGHLNFVNKFDRLYGKESIQALKKYPIFDEWKQELPNPGDFQAHNVQIRIPDVPNGFYFLLASSSPDFEEPSLISTNYFEATKIGFIQRRDKAGAIDIFVLDRLSGEALKNVKLDIQSVKNNADTEKWKTEQTFFSDKNGYIRITGLEKSWYQNFCFSYKNDTLVKKNTYQGAPIMVEKSYSQTNFFTDRSIYRPGQTVYFKGIMYQLKEGKYTISPGKNTLIKLFDASQKEIKSIQLKTNEFGSFHASFVIPENLLNGQFSIGNEDGRSFFAVEAYKRPGFEISFDTIAGQFKLNDSVTVSGTIKTFSGHSVTGADLNYKVSRSDFLPFPVYSQNLNDKQLSFGKIKSDDKGKFKITFFANGNREKDSPSTQNFNFRIEVTATDLNGETQTAVNSIHLATPNMTIICGLAEKVDNAITSKLPVEVRNLYNVPQIVNVEASIYKLSNSPRSFKEREWMRPDQFLTDRETFYTYFPDEQYDNEKSVEDMDLDYQVYQAEMNTGEADGFELADIKSWEPGYYKLILSSRDQFDEEVVLERYFTLYNSKTNQMPIPEIDWFVLENNQMTPKDSLQFIIGSSVDKLNVLYEIQQENKVILSRWLQIKNEQKKIKIPATQMNGKSFELNVLFVYNNKAFVQHESIKVFDPNTELQIKLNTFRPIIKPGTKEIWELQIKDKSGKIPISEVVATMIDASLEKIKPHQWQFSLADHHYNIISWRADHGFQLHQSQGYNNYGLRYIRPHEPGFPNFKWDFSISQRSFNMVLKTAERESFVSPVLDQMNEVSAVQNSPEQEVSLRKNFNETAFFYPNLKTDASGKLSIGFTGPESFSRWKFMALAHTRDLRIAQLSRELVTQKELMVSPNIPRFFREGDTIYFNTKIISFSKEVLRGEISLQFYDAQTMKLLNGVILDQKIQNFEIPAKSNISRQWKMIVPSNMKALVYRLSASTKNHSDGEERIIPVLPNKILVTESLPMHLNPNEKKTMKFEGLINSATNAGIKQYRLKLEMTSNPAWYAVQALPYIDADQQDNAISLFTGIYANSMASKMLNSNPQIKQVFNSWKTTSSGALNSQLEKNQELKEVLLQETPWLNEAKNETEQKQQMALFFDQNNINQKLNNGFHDLLKLQLADGSWTWFRGMRGNRYITQYILNGLLGLQSANALPTSVKQELAGAVKKAANFLNQELKKDYDELNKIIDVKFGENHLSDLQVQYLYILSLDEKLFPTSEEFEIIKAYYLSQAQKYWPEKSNYMQGMIALILFRNGDIETAELILKSLTERSKINDEMGRYWDDPEKYYWYQQPIETQAMLIRAFLEIKKDKKTTDQLRKWLINQKHTQLWNHPKASVEAVNALLLNNSQLLENVEPIEVSMGGTAVKINAIEAGTSYFEESWQGTQIQPKMGNIQLQNKNSRMAWGALHWQYFNQIDSISATKNVLNVQKQLFIKKIDKSGSHLIPVNQANKIKMGDRIVSRMVVRVDRTMEFVHLKDMRASAFEPTDVLSGYRYESGIGFYKSNTDAATNYYFERMNAGTYIFENEMFATQTGVFSNGISSIQCLYAPEYNNHSAGLKVEVINE